MLTQAIQTHTQISQPRPSTPTMKFGTHLHIEQLKHVFKELAWGSLTILEGNSNTGKTDSDHYDDNDMAPKQQCRAVKRCMRTPALAFLSRTALPNYQLARFANRSPIPLIKIRSNTALKKPLFRQSLQTPTNNGLK